MVLECESCLNYRGGSSCVLKTIFTEDHCLANKKFGRVVGPLDEILTVSEHKLVASLKDSIRRLTQFNKKRNCR